MTWPSSFWKDPHTFYWETSICLCEIIKKTCSCYDKVSNLSVCLLQCRSAQISSCSWVSTCDLVPKCRNRTDARCSILLLKNEFFGVNFALCVLKWDESYLFLKKFACESYCIIEFCTCFQSNDRPQLEDTASRTCKLFSAFSWSVANPLLWNKISCVSFFVTMKNGSWHWHLVSFIFPYQFRSNFSSSSCSMMQTKIINTKKWWPGFFKNSIADNSVNWAFWPLFSVSWVVSSHVYVSTFQR